MKFLFSEARPDYENYIFPYAIWAFPEPGETPADLFAAGFLPSSRKLDRFYLCRQVRVRLDQFAPSSENRRILRKGGGMRIQLLPRSEFEFTPARREFCQRYVSAKFGTRAMSPEGLETLFAAPVTTHVLRCTDAGGAEVGLVTLYVEGDRMAFYYYAFYDLDHVNRSLGLYLMTTAVKLFADRGARHLYLGTCYSERACYKTQFGGVEFFNGFQWSGNLAELKFLLRRQEQTNLSQHLLEDLEYRDAFGPGELNHFAARSPFGNRAI